MAERKMTIRECDRLECRHRRGVRQVEVVLTIRPEGDLPLVATGPIATGMPEIIKAAGELCPIHLEMAKAQIAGWFTNQKKY